MCGGGGQQAPVYYPPPPPPPAPPPPPLVLEQGAPATNAKTKASQSNDMSLGIAKYRNSGVNNGSAGGSSTGLGISM